MGDAEPAEGGGVTVLVVDDQQAFRNAMRALIDAAEGFTLVGDASSGEEALDLVDELSPRMVIMDKRMPGMGGIEASRAITARHPTVVVLIASVEEPDAEMLASSWPGVDAGVTTHRLHAPRSGDPGLGQGRSRDDDRSTGARGG